MHLQSVFIDSERLSWNLDPALVIETIERKVRQGKRPKAVIPVHLYGQSADLDPILEVCARCDIPVIEDAAEALGATYKGRSPGVFGKAGIFSFNGNKIITTSGGGMLVSADRDLIEHARKLPTQARDPAPHYQHSEIGYNYRLSNVLAAITPPRPPILGERDAFPPGLGGRGAEALFRDGLCLPSGTAMSDTDLARVATVVRGMHGAPPEGRQSVSSEDAVI